MHKAMNWTKVVMYLLTKRLLNVFVLYKKFNNSTKKSTDVCRELLQRNMTDGGIDNKNKNAQS